MFSLFSNKKKKKKEKKKKENIAFFNLLMWLLGKCEACNPSTLATSPS